MAKFLTVVIAGALLAAANLPAADAAQLKALDEQIHKAFADKKYDLAAEKSREAVAASPRSVSAHYNLACALARLNKPDDALAALQQAINLGFSDAEHLKADPDLESLRADQRFTEIAGKAAENARKSIEKGAELAGVKTVEEAADGAFPFRLRMSPSATAEKPDRLIVWLHPSGGSMNNVVESLAPLFVKHGFALLVVTQKNWMGWSGADAEKLLNKTLPLVAKTPGIDVRIPVLMGHSAGGQLALELYFNDPGKFGGLVVNAAYPLDMSQYQRGKTVARDLPKSDAVKTTPFFVLCGETDGGAAMWKKCEPDWKQAGVPLTLKFIPNKGHTWLFGKTEVAELAAWLDAIKKNEPK
jgi:tetratricopeptide (TPR) repeat protein